MNGEENLKEEKPKRKPRSTPTPKYPPTAAGISQRRIEVDIMSVGGMTVAAIAKALGVSKPTIEGDRAYLKKVAEQGVYEYVQARISGRINRADVYHTKALELLEDASFRELTGAAAREDLAADRMLGITGAQGPVEPPPKPLSPEEERARFDRIMLGKDESDMEDEDLDDYDDDYADPELGFAYEDEDEESD